MQGFSSQTEDRDRNNMIMHMERTLNPAWFNRRDKKDQFCTLSIMQYWDWITYIDVRAAQSALVANILI